MNPFHNITSTFHAVQFGRLVVFQTSVNAQIPLGVPGIPAGQSQRQPAGSELLYPVELAAAAPTPYFSVGGSFTSSVGKAGTLDGRIYAGRTALLEAEENLASNAHVQIVAIRNDPGVIGGRSKAGLSGYLVPLDSPTLSP